MSSLATPSLGSVYMGNASGLATMQATEHQRQLDQANCQIAAAEDKIQSLADKVQELQKANLKLKEDLGIYREFIRRAM